MKQSERSAWICSTEECINGLLHQLETGQDLDQEQCRTLQQLLGRTEPQKINEGGEDLAYKTKELLEMEDLKAEFDLQAKEAEQLIQETMELIAGGRAPDQSACSRLVQSFQSLRGCWQKVHDRALELLPEESNPGKDVSVALYVDAVGDYFSLQNKKRAADYAEILQKFLAVKAMTESYEKDLQPYQKDAGELLAELHADMNLDLDTVAERIRKLEIFLQVLECENLKSDSARPLLEQLHVMFPLQVYNGLLVGSYFLSKNTVVKEVNPEGDVRPFKSVSISVSQEEVNGLQTDSAHS